MKLRTRHGSVSSRDPRRAGYVIFAVLMVVVVLALVGYRFTDSMNAEYHASVRTSEEAQVKLAAVSGLHYAAALLADRNTLNNELGGNPFDNQSVFEQTEVPVTGATGNSRRPYFSIRAVGLNDSSAFEQRFGVIDEGGKLNINALIALDPTGQTLHDALTQLFTQIPTLAGNSDPATIVDSIVDWVDADEDARPGGAESSFYQGLPNPYMSKNGPLNSLDELLLVQGITPAILYGGDTNRNGVMDGAETDNTPGLASFVTVYGRELNVDSTGTARIYLNGDDLTTMYQQLLQAVGPDLAAYVVASKVFNPTKVAPTGTVTVSSSSTTKTDADGDTTVTMKTVSVSATPATTATTDQLWTAAQAQIAKTATSGQRIRSLVDLIGTQITLPPPSGTPANAPPVVAYSPLNDATQLPNLLPLLMDKTTVKQAIETVPRINVNTAPLEVLMSIVDQTGNPILTATEAQALITQRPNNVPTDPGTTSLAWLITTNTISSAKYKQMEKYITGTTMVYRIQSIGYFAEGGPVARMEAVVDINQGAPRFLFVRDLADIDNPPGFQPNAQQ